MSRCAPTRAKQVVTISYEKENRLRKSRIIDSFNQSIKQSNDCDQLQGKIMNYLQRGSTGWPNFWSVHQKQPHTIGRKFFQVRKESALILVVEIQVGLLNGLQPRQDDLRVSFCRFLGIQRLQFNSNQSITQSNKQSIKQSVDHSINRSITRSINHSISRSIDRKIIKKNVNFQKLKGNFLR